MSRSAAPLVALALLAAPALARAQAGPTVDPGTKLSFASSVGGATLEQTVNHAGPPTNRPDLGSSYYYATSKHMVITVQVFNGGKRVPSGSTSSIVTDQFASELDAVGQEMKGSGYTNLQRPSVPSGCTYGSLTFRCITYSVQAPTNTRFYSKLLLTGYQGHFIKVRIDWGQAMQHSAADADAALQAFVAALMH